MLTDWHLMSSTLLMLMLILRPVWLRLNQWKLFFKITLRDDFMLSQGVIEHNTSTYMTRNAHMVRHLYMDFHVAMQHVNIDVLIFDYLFKATTLRSRTMILGQTCFISYSMKMSGLFMMVSRLYLLSQ